MSGRNAFWIAVLMALWVLAWGYSLVAFATTEPSGSGFTRGANRVMQFLGWQMIAGLVSLAVFALGRGWPRGSGVRRVTWLPLALAVALLVAILGLVGWARLAG